MKTQTQTQDLVNMIVIGLLIFIALMLCFDVFIQNGANDTILRSCCK